MTWSADYPVQQGVNGQVRCPPLLSWCMRRSQRLLFRRYRHLLTQPEADA